MQIAEEFHPAFGDIKTFLQIYHKAVNGKYNFLYLQIQDGRALRNFEEVIYEDNKLIGEQVDLPDDIKDSI